MNDPKSKIVLTPDKKRRVNRPIPSASGRGEPLPPLCIEVVGPRIAVRILSPKEIDEILQHSELLWLPDKSKSQGTQPVLQILQLPERVNGCLPGISDRLQNVQEGDIFIGAGTGFQVPTNWRDIDVYLVDPNIIVAFLIENHYTIVEEENNDAPSSEE